MNHWSERREGGNRFWLLLIRWVIMHVGRGFARLWMFPTALYFYLRRGPERRASRAWLKVATGRPAGPRMVVRHIFTFAMTIVDRVLLLAGREDRLDIRSEGVEDLHAELDRGRGCVLLGSHLGSFEAIRVFSSRAPQYTLRVLMDRQQNALLTSVLESLNPGIAATVIDARRPGTQIVLDIQQVLAEGGMTAMLNDRLYPGDKGLSVPFFGRRARFPTAPLSIAMVTQAPIFLVFGLYEGGNRYRLVFERFATPERVDRRQRQAALAELIARYAGRLEHYARQYPYNWYNFYDFWNEADDTDADASGSRHGECRQ